MAGIDMKVLMVNREDAHRNLGGDTIQMLKTKAALEDLGVTIETCTVADLDHVQVPDLAHVFNIQTVEESWAAFKKLKARKIPIVLSSIYWDMLDHGFDLTTATRGRWAVCARIWGKSTARRLYCSWQRAKSPLLTSWRLQRRMLQDALAVLPNSASEGKLLRQTFLLGDSFYRRVHVVPNGIDVSLFEPLPQPSALFQKQYGIRDFVLQVGAVSPVKNQLGLLQALNDLPMPIVIIGQPTPHKPEYAEECKALAEARGNVTFIDRLPHDELPGIYRLASVHVLPSWRETPGLVSLEAAASGCRVVTTSIGSTRDYFCNLAEYCYPSDLSSIRAAVAKALAQPPSDKLRNHVLQNFTWQRAAEETLQAYLTVLNEPAKVPVNQGISLRPMNRES